MLLLFASACGQTPATRAHAPTESALIASTSQTDAGATPTSAALPPLPASASAAAGPASPSPAEGTAVVARVGNLEDGARLAHLFAALAALDDAKSHDDVHIVQFGDSHTASDTLTGVVRRLLQERFGDGGRGFVQVGRPWRTYTQNGVLGGMTSDFEPRRARADEGHAPGDGDYGLLGVALEADHGGARAWTRIDVPSSRVEVDYLQQPHGGSVDVIIDGVAAGRIATKASPLGSGFAGFDVHDGPHEVELRAVGDGDVRVFGLALDRARPGVVLDSVGINGAQITTPLRWNEEHFAEQLRHRSPDLVILAYGTNEALDKKLDLAEYERELVELLGRVARAVPSASCLLLGPPDLARRDPPEHPAWTTWPPVLDVIAVQQRVAHAAGCAFYDQLSAMGGPGSIAAWAKEETPRAQQDRVHLTRSGYAQVSTMFTGDLIHAYEAWHGTRPQAAR